MVISLVERFESRCDETHKFVTMLLWLSFFVTIVTEIVVNKGCESTVQMTMLFQHGSFL